MTSFKIDQVQKYTSAGNVMSLPFFMEICKYTKPQLYFFFNQRVYMHHLKTEAWLGIPSWIFPFSLAFDNTIRLISSLLLNCKTISYFNMCH